MSPFEWTQAVDRPALRFGEPNSDNIGYGIECIDGRIEFQAWSHRPPKDVRGGSFPTHLRLKAGGRTFDLAATGRVTDMGDGETVTTARVDAAALLEALRDGRRLMTVAHGTRGSAPTPSDEQLARLGRECGIND